MNKQPHERIFLQWEEWSEDSGVTWCQDRINDTDVEYVRADIYNHLLSNYKKMADMIDETYEKVIERKVDKRKDE